MFFHVNANSQTLDIKLSSLNKLLCSVPFSDLSIPLDEIDNIVAQPPEATAAFKGVKVGVNVPGLLPVLTIITRKRTFTSSKHPINQLLSILRKEQWHMIFWCWLYPMMKRLMLAKFVLTERLMMLKQLPVLNR